MKHKLFKSMAMLCMVTSGASFAQDLGSDKDVGTRSLESLNAIHKGKGDQHNKDFESGYYNVFVAAAGAAAANTTDSHAYYGSGCIYETVSTNGFFDVNVHLPDGHEIYGFRYYYYDMSASSSRATLYQMDGAGGLDLIQTVNSTIDTGYGSEYIAFAGGPLVVNNANGAYVIRFDSLEVGSNQRMCGVRFQMYNL